MKQEVIERVRELASGNAAPVVETKRTINQNNQLVVISEFTLSDQVGEDNQERELRLRADAGAELAVWLLRLHDENEEQANFTLRVLEYIESRRAV